MRTLILSVLLGSGSVATLPAADRRSTVEELLQSGKPLECRVKLNGEGRAQTGTIHVAGQKMRGEFTLAGGGEALTGHTIRDGEWLFSWGGPAGLKQGSKIRLSSLERGGSNVPGQPWGSAEPLHLDCRPWAVDPARFAPPADIRFADLTDQLREEGGNKEMALPSARELCSACEEGPVEAREVCRETLGCSAP